MPVKKIRKTKPRGKKKEAQLLDLRAVDPRGRLDVLALNIVEYYANKIPELRPIVQERKEVIHATLNSQLGPHVIGSGIVDFLQQVEPYAPLIGVIAQSAYNTYKKNLSNESGNGEGK